MAGGPRITGVQAVLEAVGNPNYPPRSPDYWKTISLSFGRCALTDADNDDTGTLTISRCARPASMNAIAEPVASRPTANPAAN